MIISFILFVLLVLFDLMYYGYICLGVAVVLAILVMIIAPPDAKTKLDNKEIEEIITKYIAAVECKNIYGSEISFEPESALQEDLILKASFYSSYYSKYEGNRLIKGIWKGYPFSEGHVKLMRFHSQNGTKRTINVFDGYCMSIDTNLVFPEKISIIEKYMGCMSMILNEGKEESELFYDGFNVKSEHEEIAEDFLTPELRKNITLIYEKYAGVLSIVLSPNGNIFIATGGGEKAFEEGISAEKMRVEYRKELQYPLEILECFLDTEKH